MTFRAQLTGQGVSDQNFQSLQRETAGLDERLTAIELRDQRSASNNVDTYDWDLSAARDLFINQTVGPDLTVNIAESVASVQLVAGDEYTMMVLNSTGAELTIVMGEGFRATAPTFADGSSAEFEFRVKDPNFDADPAFLVEY